MKDAISRYHWNPKEFTRQVIDIYLNIATDKFAEFVAYDEVGMKFGFTDFLNENRNLL